MKTLIEYLKLILIPAFILGAMGWWFFATIGERQTPAIQFSEDIRSIGRQKVLDLTFADAKSGLRSISVTISQDNKSRVLAATDFPQKGVKVRRLSLTLAPVALKLHDGIASLTVSAVDYSLFKNKTTIMRPVTIDLTPPQIYLLTSTNNVNPGGSCVVAFRTSEPTPVCGVQANEVFSPGYPVNTGGKPAMVVYFGLPPSPPGAGENVRIMIRDGAGNETSLALPLLFRKKKFRTDKMQLTDVYLNRRMPDFQPLSPELQGKNPLEIFNYVNATMRLANEAALLQKCRQSEPGQLWEGTFLRMKDAAPMAQFGDQRTYFYGKKEVGKSVHMGFDLASLANASVEASNSGIVKYVGNIGIYGNTILIDHGQGIFSHYAHMSVINVKVGQKLNKGDVIGKTGLTGLAVGDHLHFGIIVGGRFVNPIEWWDPHWIADNVIKKLVF